MSAVRSIAGLLSAVNQVDHYADTTERVSRRMIRGMDEAYASLGEELAAMKRDFAA